MRVAETCIKSLSFSNVKYKILQLVRSQNNAEKSQTSSVVLHLFCAKMKRNTKQIQTTGKIFLGLRLKVHFAPDAHLHTHSSPCLERSIESSRRPGLGSTHRSLVTQAWGSCAMRWPVTTKFHETHTLFRERVLNHQKWVGRDAEILKTFCWRRSSGPSSRWIMSS